MKNGKEVRFQRTLDFVHKHLEKGSTVLDLGTPNELSNRLNQEGFSVRNTDGENLDTDFQAYIDPGVDAVTAFEIFEHMFAPFNILRSLKTDKLIASVPLRYWFKGAYWNEADDWDKHYHEFEVKQFDLLMQKTGWEIKDSEKWKSPDWKKIGIRPFLRHFSYRYYIVYCERNRNL